MPEGFNLLESQKKPSEALSEKGFDLSVPQVETPTSSLQIANSNEEIIENIVKQATDTKDTESKILDELEQMDSRLLVDLPVSVNDVRRTKLAKGFFYFCFTLAVLVGSTFYATSNNLFGLGSVNFVSESKSKLVALQTESVINNYLITSVLLDKLALQSSSLNYAMNYESNSKVATVKTEMVDTITKIKKNINLVALELAANPEIESELLIKLADVKADFAEKKKAEKDPARIQNYQSLEGLYVSATKLSRNKDLRPLLLKTDVTKLDNQKLLSFALEILALTEQNNVTKIALVELNRNQWTVILSELEKIIQEYDKDFSIFESNQSSMVTLTSYSFNSDTDAITVNGEIQTDDSRLFSLIADLTDSLENSPLFKDLDINSFSKTIVPDTGLYTSSLALNFSIDNPNQQ